MAVEAREDEVVIGDNLGSATDQNGGVPGHVVRHANVDADLVQAGGVAPNLRIFKVKLNARNMHPLESDIGRLIRRLSGSHNAFLFERLSNRAVVHTHHLKLLIYRQKFRVNVLETGLVEEPPPLQAFALEALPFQFLFHAHHAVFIAIVGEPLEVAKFRRVFAEIAFALGKQELPNGVRLLVRLFVVVASTVSFYVEYIAVQ